MTRTGGRAAPAAEPVARGFRPGDERAIHALMLEVHARREHDGIARYHLDAAAARLRDEPDGCAVAEVDGQLAGWVIPDDDDLTVAPAFRRRGVGSRLVAAGRAIAARQGKAVLRLWVPERAGPEAFAAAAGLGYHSTLWRLRLPDDAMRESPAFPAGIAVRPFDTGADDEAFVALVNETFAEHPWPFRLTLDQVRRAHAVPGFDPASVLVAVDAADPRRMLGFCRVAAYPADDGRRVGEIRLVGVRREVRGIGLGRALTAWGIDRVRRDGAWTVVLAVEGANADALRLYERLGFAADVAWPHWTIPAGDEPPPMEGGAG